MSTPPVDPAVLVPDDEVFVRMSLAERWQHGLLAASFIVLILTGLPVLTGEVSLIRLVAGRTSALAIRGVIHRAAALVLIGDRAWHLVYTAFTRRGRQNLRDRMPRWQDVRDALAVFGRPSRRPEFGRYSFVEKFEYWSLIWGSAVMIITGFFMWSPGLSLNLFPLWLHQVFVVIHGYEAILAFVAILIWHMYTAHLNPDVFPMSRVWLDGGMTGADLRRFHPLEYRRILESRDRLARELLALAPVGEGAGPGTGPATPA
jgi:cytochrome b subunit of formate dehydrogenase